MSFKLKSKKEDNSFQRTQKTIVPLLPRHLELFKFTNELYNIGHYYLKTIYLHNQEVYFNSLPQEKKENIKKRHGVKLSNNKPITTPILRPYYTNTKTKDKETVLQPGLDSIFQPFIEYKKLYSGIAQHTLMLLEHDWKCWETSISDYHKNPSKYNPNS